jgi:hypothetical protein
MTQEEIKALLTTFEQKLLEVNKNQKSLNRANYKSEQLYYRHKEYLNGQADAFRDITSTLLSKLLKQGLSDLRENIAHIKGSESQKAH